MYCDNNMFGVSSVQKQGSGASPEVRTGLRLATCSGSVSHLQLSMREAKSGALVHVA